MAMRVSDILQGSLLPYSLLFPCIGRLCSIWGCALLTHAICSLVTPMPDSQRCYNEKRYGIWSIPSAKTMSIWAGGHLLPFLCFREVITGYRLNNGISFIGENLKLTIVGCVNIRVRQHPPSGAVQSPWIGQRDTLGGQERGTMTLVDQAGSLCSHPP